MRNKYISCYVAAFCAGLLSTACNDFLDEVPDNRTVIDTPEAVSELLVSAYPDANCVFFTESMSDNVTDRGNTLVLMYSRIGIGLTVRRSIGRTST